MPNDPLAETGVELSLVLLYVATKKDMPVIADLFKKETSSMGDLQSALESFEKMFSSLEVIDTSHAFMVWLGKIPLFEIELHQSNTLAPLRDEFTLEKNDFNISLMTGDFGQAELPIYVRGLQLCLNYFWKVFAAQRILAPVYTGRHAEQQAFLLKEAGLTLTLKRTNTWEPDLYLMPRPAQ